MPYTHEKTSNTIEDKNLSPVLNSIVVTDVHKTSGQVKTLSMCDNQYNIFL